MSDLWAARSQMAVSLGFHIIFAVVGIGLLLLLPSLLYLFQIFKTVPADPGDQ
jgi:cytochrome bd-type quinol oxidase subunit 1